MTPERTPEWLARKQATLACLHAQADALHIECGQVWEHIGTISLQNPDRRFRTDHSRIRIMQVAGIGRARTTRYVKVDPPRGGNGRFDRQSHRIDPITLARAYRLVDTATEAPKPAGASPGS